MMRISTEMKSMRNIGDKYTVLKLLKDSGFDAYDFSASDLYAEDLISGENYKEKLQKFREYADSIGIICNQSHAPFPDVVHKKEYPPEMIETVIRVIEASGILGAKVCVVHPSKCYTAEQNEEFYKML